MVCERYVKNYPDKKVLLHFYKDNDKTELIEK